MQAALITKLFFMKKRKNLRLALLLLTVIIAAAAVYAYKEYNRKNNNLQDAAAAFTVSPGEIITQFNNDEKKANVSFSGKIILITGNVKTVDKDEKGFYTVVMGDTASMSSVRCSIDSTESAVADLIQPNSKVKIKGVCTGFIADELGLGSDVILNRCVIATGK
jgi:cell division protein YceG involved in septum cleavage